jgi:hypothetical protein
MPIPWIIEAHDRAHHACEAANLSRHFHLSVLSLRSALDVKRHPRPGSEESYPKAIDIVIIEKQNESGIWEGLFSLRSERVRLLSQ